MRGEKGEDHIERPPPDSDGERAAGQSSTGRTAAGAMDRTQKHTTSISTRDVDVTHMSFRKVTNEGSFSEEHQYISASAASWDEQGIAPSFDSTGGGNNQEVADASTRAVQYAEFGDRRKQPFDTTTPTLIDEEDEEEMLQLGYQRQRQQRQEQQQQTRGKTGSSDFADQPQQQGASGSGVAVTDDILDASVRRLTPGAALYQPHKILDGPTKSTAATPAAEVATAADEAEINLRRTPGAVAMHRSIAGPDATSESAPSSDTARTSLSFGLPVGETGPGETQRVAWEEGALVDGVEPSPPRGPFPFAPWSRNSPTEGRAQGSGAFSPNILRLTEDIGNLLQEDEDDDYAFEIPSVFRGGNETAESSVGNGALGTGGSNVDWTGAFDHNEEKPRKPGVRGRKPVSSVHSRYRSTSDSSRPFQSSRTGATDSQAPGTSGFMPHAQQPKPQRSQVFQFGKNRPTPLEQSSSQQLLSFGGAFAPPGLSSGDFIRPVAAFDESQQRYEQTMPIQQMNDHHQGSLHQYQQAQGGSNRPRVNTIPGYLHQHESQHHPHHIQQGNFQAAPANVPDQVFREQSHSFDSYAAGNMPPGFQAPSPIQGMSASQAVYTAQQSDMQATAREFVPRSGRSSTPQYSGQPPLQAKPSASPPPPAQTWPIQKQPQAAPVQQYEATLDQGSWHSATNYNYGGGGPTNGPAFGYQPKQKYLDPRAGMTPSPHVPPSWQPPHPATQPVDNAGMYMSSGVPMPLSRDFGAPPHCVPSTSPHPSVGGSEHSGGGTVPQRAGGRKESKRKPRKKKAQKSEQSGTSGKKNISGTKKKGATRPGSTTQEEVADDTQASVLEDPENAKRLELVESPATRIAFKEFYRAFRGAERLSFQNAEDFALKSLEDESLPDSVHWRVYLELADLAKRSNRYVEARCLYQKVCELQPYASQGWLEYSKLEEECGNMNRVMNILHKGLNYCDFSENLLSRAVKHQEKMNNIENARGLLARLKHVSIDKVWRTVLEGALLEARAGNIATARRVLKYLMHHVPWYGPLYLEAYRLEKDQGNPQDALLIVEKGLQAIPRYGPLWFGAFRLCEKMDLSKKRYHLPSTMAIIERAAISISKELVWKVHLDAAQMLERAVVQQTSVEDPAFDTLLAPARRRLAMTILTCPNNLRWKVWLAAARMELGFGKTERARALFLRAHEVVPKKGRSSTLLEYARLEDFTGDTELARSILCKGRLQYCHDWKVWLEGVLLEIRCCEFLKAMEICDSALEIHQGTGRLWATLVQLRLFNGRDKAQKIALRRALNAVPKSGEVWCEGGRIHLNPFSDTFDLRRARRHLHFATRFTPQYGDGFVETIRLELIQQWLSPIATYIWEETKHAFQPRKDALEDGLTKFITDVALAISVSSQITSNQKDGAKYELPVLVHGSIVSSVRKRLQTDAQGSSIDLNDIRLACVNADPNYGLLWFHCRRKTTDTPRRIIEDAAGIIAEELRSYAHLYLAAMIRREAILSTITLERPDCLSASIETSDPQAIAWENHVDAKLFAAPSLKEIFNPTDPTTGMVLLESTVSGPLFATGLTKLNKHQPIQRMTLAARRRALFGNDALFP